jgi:hypothetical protein
VTAIVPLYAGEELCQSQVRLPEIAEPVEVVFLYLQDHLQKAAIPPEVAVQRQDFRKLPITDRDFPHTAAGLNSFPN